MTPFPEWVWLDGDFVRSADARISPFDRGLMCADGLYDTLLGVDGQPLHFELHWARFAASAETLALNLPIDAVTLRKVICELMNRCGLAKGRVRVRTTLTRGAAIGPAWDLTCDAPTLLVTAWPAPPPGTEPLALATLPWRRDPAEGIWQHKTTNLLSRGLARAALGRGGADDGLMLNVAGRVCEATTSNLFALVDGRVVTPPVEEGLLPGTVRARLLAVGVDDVEVAEEVLFPEDLRRAEAVWLANAISPVAPVGSLDGEPLRVTERAARVMEQISERL